jgi:Tat protein translocase TatB subunit
VNSANCEPAQAGSWRYFVAVLYLSCRPRYNLFPAPSPQIRRKALAVFLFILDSVGNSELLLILAAALIFFGPRRLPQLSRQIGKSLHEFRRASEDFKRTWEREVNLEDVDKGTGPHFENTILDKATERIRAAREAAALDSNSSEPAVAVLTPSVTAVDPALVQPRETKALPESTPADQPGGKQDWL